MGSIRLNTMFGTSHHIYLKHHHKMLLSCWKEKLVSDNRSGEYVGWLMRLIRSLFWSSFSLFERKRAQTFLSSKSSVQIFPVVFLLVFNLSANSLVVKFASLPIISRKLSTNSAFGRHINTHDHFVYTIFSYNIHQKLFSSISMSQRFFFFKFNTKLYICSLY